MAASKLAFLTQPSGTTQGWTLQGGAYDSVNLHENHGIRVAVQDSTGAIVTTDTSSVTLAFGTNPTSGSVLQGTLTQVAVQGIATFPDLAVSLGGNGYTIIASDGALSTATTNAFNILSVARTNPFAINGTITATGVANAIGPYRYRGSSNMNSIRIAATSTNVTDVCSIIFVEPGVAPSVNVDEAPIISNYTPASGLTCPFNFTIDRHQMGGEYDVYVFATTATGTISVKIQRVP